MRYKYHSYIRDLNFIHFGNSTILSELNYNACRNFKLNKPANALWASLYTPDDLYKSSWEKYCIENKMLDKVSEYTLFRLKSNSKILIIDSFNDLMSLSDKYINKELISSTYITENVLNINNIQSDFDGMYVTSRGLDECSSIFHEWEVESLALFTSNIVVKAFSEK